MAPLRFPPRKRPRLNPPAPGAGPPFAAIRRASSARRSPGAPPPTALPALALGPFPVTALHRSCALQPLRAPHLRSAHSAAFPRPASSPTLLAQTSARPSARSLARPPQQPSTAPSCPRSPGPLRSAPPRFSPLLRSLVPPPPPPSPSEQAPISIPRRRVSLRERPRTPPAPSCPRSAAPPPLRPTPILPAPALARPPRLAPPHPSRSHPPRPAPARSSSAPRHPPALARPPRRRRAGALPGFLPCPAQPCLGCALSPAQPRSALHSPPRHAWPTASPRPALPALARPTRSRAR